MSNIILTVLLGFLLSTAIGMLTIPLFIKLKLGQNIREEAPKSHSKKAGTPTFGGVIFIFSIVIVLLFSIKQLDKEIIIMTYALLTFGFIGFIDDVLKKIHKKNQGLTAIGKLLLLILASSLFAIYAYNNPSIGPIIIIPFAGKMFNLGWLYIPFITFFYVATTNAVNLTDGLDGLAASITLLIMTFFVLTCLGMGFYSLSIFCASVTGALLGFLRYNSYPAKIIMGDTGSLALGGVVATIAMLLKDPLIILIVGGVYVLETLSVAIQIFSCRLFGKRIFKMAPIHHSFELSGWHEAKIVSVFSIITALLCLIGFLSF